MATQVVGSLVYIIPVVFVVNEDSPRSPEDQYIAWAAVQKVLSPDGVSYSPGVSQDENRKNEEIVVPFDGIILDYVDDGQGNMKI